MTEVKYRFTANKRAWWIPWHEVLMYERLRVTVVMRFWTWDRADDVAEWLNRVYELGYRRGRADVLAQSLPKKLKDRLGKFEKSREPGV